MGRVLVAEVESSKQTVGRIESYIKSEPFKSITSKTYTNFSKALFSQLIASISQSYVINIVIPLITR